MPGGEAPKERPLDPDDLARDSMRFYDKGAAGTSPTPKKEPEEPDEDALLDPDSLGHEIERSHPGFENLPELPPDIIDEDPAEER